MTKMIIICGPTTTGKTELGLRLAKKFNGEIVSADSRQVYKGMDIGTGKDISNFKFQISKIKFNNKNIGYYENKRLKIWGLDIVNPDYQFNVGEYKKIAEKIIADILKRGKLPIVVGGTGLYIKSLIEPLEFVSIPPNEKVREEVRNLGIKELKNKLQKIDNERYLKMNNSDRNNPRRLIRAIEIANYLHNRHSGEDPPAGGDDSRINNGFWTSPSTPSSGQRGQNDVKVLLIGLTAPKEVLYKRVKDRIKKRLGQGIIKEIKSLLKRGYEWELPSMSGLGYKEFHPFFKKKAELSEVLRKWQQDEIKYLKRQLVWFKKMPNIHWFDITKPEFYTEMENLL
ncbi:tRNA dimethylallyltransferase [Candidatus Gottesmanbacteria bacterium]|nr:tRNA dimethylallyltransferase [Candidatus Gottesmanbacteria bacterium]